MYSSLTKLICAIGLPFVPVLITKTYNLVHLFICSYGNNNVENHQFHMVVTNNQNSVDN